MSNFIELTNYDNGDVALINLDQFELICPMPNGGTQLMVANSFDKHGNAKYLHVRESYNLVKQLIRRRRKSVPDAAFRFELKDEYMMTVCDKICRFRDKAKSQDELDKICDACPLVNFFEVM